MPEAPSDPVEVYRARGLPDAHALRLLLDAEGVSAWVDNEHLQGAAGDLPLGWATAPRVMVRRPDEAAARAVAARFAHGQPPPDPAGGLACLACRAPMGPADTCPACGWSYHAEAGAADPEPADAAPAPAAPASPPGPAVPPAGGREGWAEVAAVLAVGVVPYLLSAAATFFAPPAPGPYWLDALQLTVLGGCTSFVTLYLIHRSGAGWAAFGVVRPGAVDLGGGLVFLFVAYVLWALTAGLPDVGRPPPAPYPQPGGPLDLVLLAVKYAASAFAEELVCRAYLVTRLAGLLRSPTEAVVYAAAAFASYHVYQGLQGVGFAFALGVGYGAAFLVVRRVWPLAVGHALYDILVDLSAG